MPPVARVVFGALPGTKPSSWQTVYFIDSLRSATYDLDMSTPSIADTYLSIPELMRVARGSYKRAADIELAAGGFEDLPTASGYLLGYIAGGEESIQEKIEGLGIKRREFRQLVDTLVLRGYITRTNDPTGDTWSFALTERGHAANEANYEGARSVDEELERRLSEAEMAGLRRGLAVLGEIKRSLTGPVIRRGLPR
jgi:DNA-binding MarR family transcriptional regulator